MIPRKEFGPKGFSVPESKREVTQSHLLPIVHIGEKIYQTYLIHLRQIHETPTEDSKMGVESLQKHVYSNILKFSPSKTENFQIKILIFFSYFCSKHILWVLV